MRAMMQLDTLPEAPVQAKLQQHLEAMPGVVDAVLQPVGQTVYVDFDPTRTNDEAIAAAIRSFGVAIVSMGTVPGDLFGPGEVGQLPLTP